MQAEFVIPHFETEVPQCRGQRSNKLILILGSVRNENVPAFIGIGHKQTPRSYSLVMRARKPHVSASKKSSRQRKYHARMHEQRRSPSNAKLVYAQRRL